MELEYSDKTAGDEVYIAGVIIALVFAAPSSSPCSPQLAPAADVEMRTVVVAAADIAARTPITVPCHHARRSPRTRQRSAFTSVDEASTGHRHAGRVGQLIARRSSRRQPR